MRMVKSIRKVFPGVMSLHFTTAHMMSLLITLLLVTLVGVSAARKVKTAADFTVGGQSSGVPLIIGTIIGTIVGGASTVGTAQLAFSVGLSAWWFTLGAGIALLVLAFFYAAPLRATGLQTIPDLLTLRYGAAAGPLASMTSSVGIFFSIVANILSATPLISAMFAISSPMAAGVVSLLIIGYVFFGGIWGTGIVGIIKTVLIYITLLFTAVITFQDMGGTAGFIQAFPPFPWFSLFGRGGWVDAASALSLLVGTLSTQTYIQAIFAAKDSQAARTGALSAALITLPTGIPAVMAGLFMRVHHPDIEPIQALPLFIIDYLPPWLGGVALATLLLASIGSAAGLALGVATMLSRDVVRVWQFAAEPRTALWVNRAVLLAITLCAAAFTFGNLQSLVLEWNYLSMGLRGAGIFLPLTVAVFCPDKVDTRFAIGSIISGAFTALVWKTLCPQGLDPLYAGLAASGCVLLAGMVFDFGRQKAV